MNDQRLAVADVGQVAEQLNPVDHLDPTFLLVRKCRSLDTESKNYSASLGKVLLTKRIRRMIFEARVIDQADLGMRLQKVRDSQRVFTMSRHPQMQRFQPLQHLERVEWTHCRAEVAQQLSSRLENIGNSNVRTAIFKINSSGNTALNSGKSQRSLLDGNQETMTNSSPRKLLPGVDYLAEMTNFRN